MTQLDSARLSASQHDSAGLIATLLSQKFPFFWRPFTKFIQIPFEIFFLLDIVDCGGERYATSCKNCNNADSILGQFLFKIGISQHFQPKKLVIEIKDEL